MKLLLPIAFLVIIGSFMGMIFSLRMLWNAKTSIHWPKTLGSIIESKVEMVHGTDGGSSWNHKLRYHYCVAGVEYEGKRSCMGSQGISGPNCSFAQRMVSLFPLGKQVDVYYNPSKPNDSVLLPGIQKVTFMPLLFSLLFFCVFSLMCLMYYCYT